MRTLVASPKPSLFSEITGIALLNKSVEEFPLLLDAFLGQQNDPSLVRLQGVILRYLGQASLNQFHELLQILISKAAIPSSKKNLKFIEYLIVKLYRAKSSAQSPQAAQKLALVSLSLYCDFSL
jgi:hypothetical protein